MPRRRVRASRPSLLGSRRGLPRVAQIALVLPLVAIALWCVSRLVYVFWHRHDFPMDLEWMEGGQLYHAYRLLHGLPVYGDCLDGFIPFPYPPIHIALLAAAGSVFGLDYPVARLVSVAGFAACCVVLCREVLLAAGRKALAAIMATVALAGICAGFPFSGEWYDVIRVDSVFAALLFAGAALSLPAGRWPHARVGLPASRIALCAAVLSAAVFAKQTAVFFLPWIGLFALWRDRRSGLWLIVAIGAFCSAGLAALMWATDGRFWTYIVVVMSRHPMLPIRGFWNLVRYLVYAPFAVAIVPIAWWLWRTRRLRLRSVFWIGMWLCALTASLITTTKTGAHTNNMMTAELLRWPEGLILVADLLRATGPRPLARVLSVATLAVLGALWLKVLSFDPRGYVPDHERWQRARALNRMVASLEGGVLFPAHSFIPIRNGHLHPQLHRQGYVDAMESNLRSVDFITCFQGIDAEWLILGSPYHPYFGSMLMTAYEPVRRLPDEVRLDGMGYGVPDALSRRRAHIVPRVERTRRRRLFDFESGRYDGWQTQGEAFGAGPSTGAHPNQFPIVGYRGEWVANSFDPRLGDLPTGSLRSPEFTIDRSRLGFLVGGSAFEAVKVQLEVDGRVVRELAGGGRGADLLVPVVWDVAELGGKRARLVLVDGDSAFFGHLTVDEVELFDEP